MDRTPHPAATQHMPMFVTAPGDTDVLMMVTAFILLGAVVAFGVLFLTLHTLPERMAHKSRSWPSSGSWRSSPICTSSG